MSFKLGEILRHKPEILNREDRCPLDKKAFYSKAEAQAALKKINPGQRTPMTPFRCDYCDLYHIGHPRGKV